MRNLKTVTPEKAEANRRNSKHSTGPRTPRGKQHSKFNAVKTGLYANEVVIPQCDGDNADEAYRELRGQLYKDLLPVGTLESLFAETLVEGFWALRRAARAERGSAVVRLWNASASPSQDSLGSAVATSIAVAQRAVAILDDAAKKCCNTHTLPEALYAVVIQLLGDEEQSCEKPPRPAKDPDGVQSTASDRPPSDNDNHGRENRGGDNSQRHVSDDFIQRIEDKKSVLQFIIKGDQGKLREVQGRPRG